jgi:hypothetical protein
MHLAVFATAFVLPFIVVYPRILWLLGAMVFLGWFVLH